MKMRINIENKVIAKKRDIFVSTRENNLYIAFNHRIHKAFVVLSPTELKFYEKSMKVPKSTFRRANDNEIADFIILLMKFTKERSLDKVFE